jgi:hypothetical protein
LEIDLLLRIADKTNQRRTFWNFSWKRRPQRQSRFICSVCGSSRDCDCDAPALERVVAYDKANPGKSTRQAAADLGLGNKTVARARTAAVSHDTPAATVTGRDGKTYLARQKPKAKEPDTESVAAADAARADKYAKEIIRLLKEAHAARREIARLKQKYEHKPDIHNGMTVPERLIAHLQEAFQLIEVGLVRSDKVLARPQPGTRLPRGNTLGRASRRSLRTNGRTVDPTTPMPGVSRYRYQNGRVVWLTPSGYSA